MMAPEIQKPLWTVRRRLVVATLAFCAFCITWIMIKGDDRGVNEVIVMGAFGVAFSTLGSYIFGAVWDDKNTMNLLGPKAFKNKDNEQEQE